MESLYPLVFEPVYKQYIWGGKRFASRLGRPLPTDETFAESWELADHPNGQTVLANGPLQGTSLADLVKDHAEGLLGASDVKPTQFPVMMKLLDATSNLSVQVHPSDEIAQRMGLADPRGKTEAWIVIDAEPGSRIYAGFNQSVTRELFEQKLGEGAAHELLHWFEAKPGDFVFIPAGTVHALGAGCLIAEVQQMSDTTFRMSDWGRVGADGKPRQLHVAESLEAVDYKQLAVDPLTPVAMSEGEASRWSTTPDEASRLIECPYFGVDRFRLTKPTTYTNDGACRIWSVLAGQGELAHLAIDPIQLSMGSTVVLPASLESLTLTPATDEPLLLMDAIVP